MEYQIEFSGFHSFRKSNASQASKSNSNWNLSFFFLLLPLPLCRPRNEENMEIYVVIIERRPERATSTITHWKWTRHFPLNNDNRSTIIPQQRDISKISNKLFFIRLKEAFLLLSMSEFSLDFERLQLLLRVMKAILEASQSLNLLSVVCNLCVVST